MLFAFATIAASVAAAAAFSPVYVGINNGDHETDAFSLTDTAFQKAIASIGYGTYRYPGGTTANYWDWKQGCETGSNSCGKNNNTIAAFATSKLTQLEFLAACSAAGVPVKRVELGNEFFNNHADYVAAFPTGADYGKAAAAWAKAIAAVYPDASFAAVGQPSVVGHNPRTDGWNAAMLPALSGSSIAAVTMHEYHDTQIGTAPAFTDALVPTMLGAPAYWMAGLGAFLRGSLPAQYSVWMTEFNIKDTTASGVTGTWAHGLYMATTILLALNESSSRVSALNVFCSIKDAQLGTLFEDTQSFDYALSPDPKLVTATYDRSATGWATSLLAAAALNRTSATPVAFKSNPQAQGATAKYDTLVGVSFGSPSGSATGAAVNLGPTAQPLDLSPFGSAGAAFTSMAAASGSATAAVNNAAKLAIAKGSVGAGGSLTLPPFSLVSWEMH